jgi:hypothetical protein
MKTGFFLGFLCFCFAVQAQSITPLVVNSSGGILQNGSNVLVFSAGETAIARYSSSTNRLTEGFLQPHFVAAVGIAEFHVPDFRFYPNPVTGSLFIENSNPGIKSLRLYNALGQEIMEVGATDKMIDMSGLRPGLYIMAARDISGGTVQTFKLIKE